MSIFDNRVAEAREYAGHYPDFTTIMDTGANGVLLVVSRGKMTAQEYLTVEQVEDCMFNPLKKRIYDAMLELDPEPLVNRPI